MEQPKLRFKDFEDEWKGEKIKGISKNVIGGGTPNTKIDKYWHGKIPWIRSSDLTENDLTNVKIEKHVNNFAIRNTATKLIPKDSIAVVVRVGVGKLAYMNTNYTTSQDFLSFSSLNGNPYYLIYCLKLAIDKEKLNLQGTAIKGITKSYLLSRKVNISPSIQEQNKIGHYFNLLDKMIKLHQEKLKHLKRLKRGYLQKMFTDGDIPRLRFKGFNDEFKHTSLNKLVSIKTGNKNVEDNDPNGKYVFFDRSTEIKKLNTFDYDGKVIVYAGEGSKFFPRYFNGKYSLHQRAYGLYNFKSANPLYLYAYLMTTNRTFVRFSVGTTANSLRKETFNHINVPIPSLPEQTQIGHFFTLLDKQIELANQKLLTLQKIKKAYLQKMFI